MHVFTIAIAFSAAISTAFSACTKFTTFVSYSNLLLNDTDFAGTVDPTRASNTISCGPNKAGGGSCNASYCSLSTTPYQLVRIDRHLNLSVSETEADEVFDLIRPRLPGDVITEASWVYSTGGGVSSACVEQGTSAWWAWSPMYSCVLGLLSECSGNNSIENGTVVFACAMPVQVQTINDVVPRVFGYLEIARAPSGRTEGPPANATIDGKQAERLNGASGMTPAAERGAMAAIILTGIVGMVVLV